MPRARKSQPAYQSHLSGQARVTLGGKDFYLGKHNSPESLARYYTLLAEYNANGKQAPEEPEAPAAETHQADSIIRIKHIVADSGPTCCRIMIMMRADPIGLATFAT